MMEKSKKLPRDYDGSQYGIDLNSTTTQPMAEIDPSSDLNEPYHYEVKDGMLTIIVGEDATYSHKLVS